VSDGQLEVTEGQRQATLPQSGYLPKKKAGYPFSFVTDNYHMNATFWLTAVSAVIYGILAGVSFDVAAVKLPTRKRIGVIAYAAFARGNDLGNGLVVYPAAGIFALVLAFGTTVWAHFTGSPKAVMIPLLAACIGTIAHSACTGMAAPIMLSLRNAPDEEKALAEKLDRFALWHACRAIFQFLTFIAMVWALVEASRSL
jgi:hypothetical protein